MRGAKVVILFSILVLLGTTLVGCKDGIPESDLDVFISDMSELSAPVQADSLRAIASHGGIRASYATYLTGNNFYKAAADTARLSGWGSAKANALLDSAEIYFGSAVTMDSTFVEALVNLGSVWDDRSEQLSSRDDREAKVSKAEEFYKRALEVSPLDEKARCNLGSLYLRQRRTMDAKKEFQAVIDANPRSSLAHYNMAIMFAEAKIYREAIAEWELAVKYDPDGDIGGRSQDNIGIVKDLMKTPIPNNGKKK